MMRTLRQKQTTLPVNSITISKYSNRISVLHNVIGQETKTVDCRVDMLKKNKKKQAGYVACGRAYKRYVYKQTCSKPLAEKHYLIVDTVPSSNSSVILSVSFNVSSSWRDVKSSVYSSSASSCVSVKHVLINIAYFN